MPGLHAEPEAPHTVRLLPARSPWASQLFVAALGRARGTSRIGSGGTQCAHTPHRMVMDALDLAAQSLAEPAEHGLPQMALEIARPFGFPITNSMIVTGIVAVGLIVFAQRATRKMTQVPGSAQNFLEFNGRRHTERTRR